MLAYIGTLPERHGRRRQSQPADMDVHRQPAEPQPVASISWRTRKRPRSSSTPGRSSTRPWSALEVSNERIGIDRYTGLSSEAFGDGSTGNGALQGQSIYAPQLHVLPVRHSVAGRKSDPLSMSTPRALYVIDTANWQDTIILNGGVRYDGYRSCDRRHNTTYLQPRSQSDFVNYNVGIVFKPVPIGSLYAAYATSTNPFGSELDGTGARLRRRSRRTATDQSSGPSATRPPKSAPSGSCSIATCW